MTKEQDKIRVGSTPNLRYTLKDPRGVEVDVTTADTLSIQFVAPSGGSDSTGTPIVLSGEVAIVDFQCLTTTFDAQGLWLVAVKAVFGANVYESTVDEIHVDASRF